MTSDLTCDLSVLTCNVTSDLTCDLSAPGVHPGLLPWPAGLPDVVDQFRHVHQLGGGILSARLHVRRPSHPVRGEESGLDGAVSSREAAACRRRPAAAPGSATPVAAPLVRVQWVCDPPGGGGGDWTPGRVLSGLEAAGVWCQHLVLWHLPSPPPPLRRQTGLPLPVPSSPFPRPPLGWSLI